MFAKSCLRGDGCNDAGTESEPHDNLGKMAFYQVIPLSPQTDGEVKQYAQAAKRKPAEGEPTEKRRWYHGFSRGEHAEAQVAAASVAAANGARMAALE